jgi:tetratricopeptide (TPR) repeat protein
MSGNLFIPKSFQDTEEVVPVPAAVTPTIDKTVVLLQKILHYLVIGISFLLPVFFIPGLPATLNFDKVILTLTVSLFVIVILSLSALRTKKVVMAIPFPLIIFWGVVLVGIIGAFLSGDTQGSLRGLTFEPQTAGFLALMALAMSIPLVLQKSKVMSLKVMMVFGIASSLVIVYTILRIIFGSSFLGLGSFLEVTNSPVGGFNDLAILSALTIIIGLITLLLLPLKKGLQIGIFVLTTLAILVMAVVNFFYLWIVIGFFGLLLLVYILSRNTMFPNPAGTPGVSTPPLLTIATIMICAVSIVFIFAGEFFGTQISNITGISYLEVRPSAAATIDIAKSVYQENILLGSGPNRFVDAWSLYKDQSINETIFWSVDFVAGYSFMLTLFITLGVLGMSLLLVFQGWFLYMGYRMLLKSPSTDSFWNYFGVVSFVGSVFLWGMSYVYVPNATTMLITALFTGLSFVAFQALVPSASKEIPLVTTRGRGFAIMTIAIVVIVVSVSALFSVGKQYAAQLEFSKARNADSIESFDQLLQNAATLYLDDTFISLRAQARLTQLREISVLAEPTTEDQERFVALAEEAIILAQNAISLNPANPDSYSVLANIYSILAIAGLADAEARATATFEDAIFRDPFNPEYALLKAYLAVQLNDFERARGEITEALALKSNYTEALFLLSQLDIQEGNTEAAITTTRQIITLEPNNPTRYYQLGILLNANTDTAGAITAFEAALARDTNFANARYLLALTYAQTGRTEDALRELRIVQATNEDNAELANIINQIETTGTVSVSNTNLEPSINEDLPTQVNGEAVTAGTAPDTDLVSPVNTPSNNSEAATSAPVTSPQSTQ